MVSSRLFLVVTQERSRRLTKLLACKTALGSTDKIKPDIIHQFYVNVCPVLLLCPEVSAHLTAHCFTQAVGNDAKAEQTNISIIRIPLSTSLRSRSCWHMVPFQLRSISGPSRASKTSSLPSTI
jgi:hypothetical protein